MPTTPGMVADSHLRADTTGAYAAFCEILDHIPWQVRGREVLTTYNEMWSECLFYFVVYDPERHVEQVPLRKCYVNLNTR